MDASAYLRKQGWRGNGHSLDDSNRGIRKPLLISKKVDVLGVGLKKHAAVSDQWWLRAFDQGLKTLGTGEQSVLANVQKHGVNRGGLYARFVKGDNIPGSLGKPLAVPRDGAVGAQRDIAKDVPDRHVDIPTERGLALEGHNTQSIMAVDLPTGDKVEQAVGIHTSEERRNTILHLMQNPDEAPSSMRTMPGKKRKRVEGQSQKHARRKVEDDAQTRASHEKRRLRGNNRSDEHGSQSSDHTEIDGKVQSLVFEAQQHGWIPVRPSDVRRGADSIVTGANATPMSAQPSDQLQQIFSQAGLVPATKSTREKSAKAQKYERESLERAAKAFLMGEMAPRERGKEEKHVKKEEEKVDVVHEKVEEAKAKVEGLAKREQRVEWKRQGRVKRRKEKAEINRPLEEREATAQNSKSGEELKHDAQFAVDISGVQATDAAARDEADCAEVDETPSVGSMTIPGKGAVDRYPTKAERRAKKAKALEVKEGKSASQITEQQKAKRDEKQATKRRKIDSSRAMEQGLSLEEYRLALADGKLHTPKVQKMYLTAEKRDEYAARAKAKGVTLEQYIQRRQERYARRQVEKLERPQQQAQPQSNGVRLADEMDLFVDTTGFQDTLDIGEQARTAIVDNTALTIQDDNGEETFTWQPDMPVPHDPRIWQGCIVKDLPKSIRKARRDWRAAKREAQKAQDSHSAKKGDEKSKAQRKSPR